ncbi:hypothetical protein [Paenibacillus polymyxa]|uniref:Uncharacterized protein n=1 Tax=Paenibacillus polymyxa TaxID=1406 RepID=A0A378Y0M8_PAEPO|nr:hypothetical protein [Paenibacillus polymyxa]MBE7901071.1 hypothetical protein [Paenibacillus polymyxa]MBG9765069.1 hypothetical protein [Paenibacillus polymyxa]MCC3261574.1 hypothetical protein [Paenibacillus polymyxa]MEE4578818.1 hypothetical protein [Paenibacillus polymyxa]QPK54976.1 hypothetical protein G7035_21210 [Paenibacillus polymyxa]
MFYEFSHRHTPCVVDGNEDVVILSRETKATTVLGKEYVYNGVFSPESLINRGSLVQTEDTFLVLTLRKTVDQDNYCSLVKTNAVVEVQRYQQAYDVNDNPVGDAEFTSVAADVVCFAQYVTAQLRQQEPGLLSSTVFVLQMQTTVDVKRPEETTTAIPDRIVMGGKTYQVDEVDRMKYPNLLHVQLSEDRR